MNKKEGALVELTRKCQNGCWRRRRHWCNSGTNEDSVGLLFKYCASFSSEKELMVLFLFVRAVILTVYYTYVFCSVR
jgi:hypothetical protein